MAGGRGVTRVVGSLVEIHMHKNSSCSFVIMPVISFLVSVCTGKRPSESFSGPSCNMYVLYLPAPSRAIDQNSISVEGALHEQPEVCVLSPSLIYIFNYSRCPFIDQALSVFQLKECITPLLETACDFSNWTHPVRKGFFLSKNVANGLLIGLRVYLAQTWLLSNPSPTRHT